MWLFLEDAWARIAGWLSDPRKRREAWDRKGDTGPRAI
jgi:hypothetical protein